MTLSPSLKSAIRIGATVFAFTVLARPVPAIAQTHKIPTPASILGWEPGADQKLPSWKQVTEYFSAVDKASPNMIVRTLGPTTLGRPFIVAFISDSANLARLEHFRQVQRQLMDPRGSGRVERREKV